VGWPLEPTEGELGNGFMWSDFITHDAATPMLLQRGRGLAFGRPVTDHLLRTTPLVGFLRAHQHNNARDTGPMLDAVTAGGGAFDNWNGSGHVVTLLSGAHIPDLGFGSDAYALLTLPQADPASWRLALCSNPVGEQWLRGVDETTRGASGEAAAPVGEGGNGGGERDKLYGLGVPDVAHACNARRAFACRPLPWRPAG
jgi:hypothetical protein